MIKPVLAPDSCPLRRPAADGSVTAERIAQAAAAVWAEDGPSTVTYGSVATRSGIGKSLVSHYFPDHERLLRAAAEGAAAMVEAQIDLFFAKASSLAGEGAPAAEIIGYFIEDLACGPHRSGAILLEIAGLALRAPAHRDLFFRLIIKIQGCLAIIGGAETAPRAPIVVLLIGELLDHCPQQSTPLAMIGLRERVAWCLNGAPANTPPFLAEFLDAARRSRAPRPIGGARSVVPAPAAGKREKIIAATLDILVESDAMMVAHREIARRAQLPLAATTYHFRSKIEILEAAYQHIIQSAAEAARAIVTEAQDTGQASFLALIARMMDFYSGDGVRNTLANFHLALSACRRPSLASFARRARGIEIDLVLLQAERHGVAIERNAARLITSIVGGIVLFDLLDIGAQEGQIPSAL
jgi:AcrR family transcriptional regulator